MKYRVEKKYVPLNYHTSAAKKISYFLLDEVVFEGGYFNQSIIYRFLSEIKDSKVQMKFHKADKV